MMIEILAGQCESLSKLQLSVNLVSPYSELTLVVFHFMLIGLKEQNNIRLVLCDMTT